MNILRRPLARSYVGQWQAIDVSQESVSEAANGKGHIVFEETAGLHEVGLKRQLNQLRTRR